MQASGRLPPPRLYLEGLPSPSFPAPPSYVETWGQVLMTDNPRAKALPRVTLPPKCGLPRSSETLHASSLGPLRTTFPPLGLFF